MSKYSMDRVGIGIPEFEDEDLENLRNLARWLEPGYEREAGEHLIGPQYERLMKQGLIRALAPGDAGWDPAMGRVIAITAKGREVLAEWGGDG